MKKYVLYGVLALLVPVGLLAGVATGTNPHNPPGGTTTNGHTPVTICHKPGTPAEQTLVVDDDSVELTGHLGHGDTVGACEQTPPPDACPDMDGYQESEEECAPPTDVCPDLEGVQTSTEECPPPPPVDYCETLEGIQAEDEDCPPGTVPTTPTTPTPPGHDCVFVGADKDGGHDAYGGTNDDCAPAPSEETTPTPPSELAPPATFTPQQATTPTVTETAPPPPTVKAKPKPRKVAVAKKKVAAKKKVTAVKKQPKLTGDPKKDKCKNLGNGTLNCKGIVVTPGQG